MLTVLSFLRVFVYYLREVFSVLIFVRVVLSWIPARKVNIVTRLVYDTTEPLFALIYRFIPQMRRSALDFAPLLAFVLINVISSILIYLIDQLALVTL